MTATDLLDDAQLLLDRSQRHKRELDALLGVGPGQLWNVHRTVLAGGNHAAELRIDRDVQRRSKPVLADVTNALIHALDHVTAAARKSARLPNPRTLCFPIELDDADYNKRVAKKVAPYLDQPWVDLLATAREEHRPYLPYLQLVRTVSREAKHWELTAGTARAVAVQWFPPDSNEHKIVEMPVDHFAANDSFPIWEGTDPFPNIEIEIVIGYRIAGDGIDTADVESVLSTSSRFVSGIIDRSRTLLAAPPAPN